MTENLPSCPTLLNDFELGEDCSGAYLSQNHRKHILQASAATAKHMPYLQFGISKAVYISFETLSFCFLLTKHLIKL